jgi:hypothetical protein
MTPAQSTRERLPTALRVHWETQRPHCAATRRHQAAVPDEAVAMAVALAGVRAPMKAGARHANRQPARAKGPWPSGPAGYQDGGWATGSSSDRPGARLCTRRMARMPEGHKAPRKSQLTAEGLGALIQRPD